MPEPRVLASFARIGIQRGVLYLGFGSVQQEVTDMALWEPLVLTARYVLEPRTDEEIVGYLTALGVTESDALRVLSLLEPLLVDLATIDWSDRYSRHQAYYQMTGADPRSVQERLARAHVLLIGCGGIGGLVAAALATAGIGTLTLMDDDRVELSNLTRQLLFTEADVGTSKVAVARERLVARNGTIRIQTLELAATDNLSALPACDFIVLSADSAGIVPAMNAHCATTGTPWLHVCYVNDIAAWGPLIVPGVTGCWSCTNLAARDTPPTQAVLDALKEINSRYRAPSFGPVNMLSSSLAALDVLRHLGGFDTPVSLNRRVGLHTSPALAFEYHDCPRDPRCVTCRQ